jgi:sulfoxide reductase heme-binding subunit YedZ
MTGAALSAAASGVSPLWYATRATGVVALVLLTITVILGIAGTARFTAPGLPRVVTAGLHRNVSLLVLALLTVHVLTTVLDSYARIGLASAIIPFTSNYRGLWLGLGTVAFDLLLAVTVTSLLRDRLSYRTWRAVHFLSYACWPIALWHGLGTGTDSELSWLLLLDALCVAGVAGAAWWRLSLAQPGAGRTAAIAATVLVPLGTAAFVFVGPLQPGWARRAGTPVALLGSATAHGSTAHGAAATAAPASAWSPGTAAFTGRVRQAAGPGSEQVTITVDSRTSGTPRRTLTIVLRGTPAGGGIAMSSGTVRLSSVNQAAAAEGPVTALDGHRLTAILHEGGGTEQEADVMLIISGASASGQLTLRTAGGA